MTLRARCETFGGLVDTGEDIVAVNRAAMRALGVLDSPLWRSPSPSPSPSPSMRASDAPLELTAPIEAQLILTTRCLANCDFCSVDATPDGIDMSVDEARRTLDDLAARGVFTIAFGGGEPLLHASLIELARYAKSLGMHATLTTSGLIGGAGVSARDLVLDLAIFDAVHVSLRPHGPRALERITHANLGLNVIVEHARLDDVDLAFALAERHRLRAVQLLRIKPAGRARLDFASRDLDEHDERHVVAAVERAVHRGLRVRVDCALATLFSTSSALPGASITIAPTGAERDSSLVGIGRRSDNRRREP